MKHKDEMSVQLFEKKLLPIKNKEVVEKLYWEYPLLGKKVIVTIDDDPTGIQTVHGIKVYMDWTEGSVDEIFREGKLAYIQTNSRGLVQQEAERINREIMLKLIKASKKYNREFSVISRSDSSLRGHYPAETKVLKEVYEQETTQKIDAELLIPAFFEAGRVTFNDVHYLKDTESLIPMSETEFAKDVVFGYKNSDLKHYVEEKTKGNYKAEEVLSIQNSWLRNADIDAIEQVLLGSANFQKIIVNAVDYHDLQVLVLAIRRCEDKGKRFLFRTAASFVKAYAGVPSKPLLAGKDLSANGVKSMLIIAGSHTAKTTQQIEKLKEYSKTQFHEIQLVGVSEQEEIEKAVTFINTCVGADKIPVVFTQRKQVFSTSGTELDNLNLSARISSMLVSIVQQLKQRPDVMLAKGGITSSDLAVKGLSIQKAEVLGQILPGVPVILPGQESKWPGMPYIIYPGNVGTSDSLLQIVQKLFLQ